MKSQSALSTSSRCALRALTCASLFALVVAAHASPPPAASFSAIGNASNYSNPGAWEHDQVDVTSFVAGASSAVLSFDIANDLPGTGSTSTNLPTNAHLYFAVDGGVYYLNFEYFLVGEFGTPTYGNSSAHFRDVQLTIDGAIYRDQFGAFSNHLGDALLGTAGDGDGPGQNILGQTGFEGRTYVLTAPVPEPETWTLMLAGIALVGSVARRRWFAARTGRSRHASWK